MPATRPTGPHAALSVRPCLYGPADLPAFLQHTFNAVPLETGDHGRVLLQLGASVVAIDVDRAPPGVLPAAAVIEVQVGGVDTSLARAIDRGATSLGDAVTLPDGSRRGGFIDSGGNTWWVVGAAG